MITKLYSRIKTGLKDGVVAWASSLMGYPM